MKLKRLSGNSTLLQYGDLSKTEVLFSYETPVAIRWLGSGAAFVTEEKFSRTTSKHINKYLESVPSHLDVKRVPQSWIEDHVQ